MLRGNDLCGRPVVDLDLAEKIGEVEEICLDLDARRVAALVVSQGHSFLRGRPQLLLPASSIRGTGPDAVTVRRAAHGTAEVDYLASLPRLSDVTERKLISHSGKLLGSIADVLINGQDGRIVGFAFVEPNTVGGLGTLFGGDRARRLDYVRADTDFRVGHSLIVAPDEAVVRGQATDDDRARAASESSEGGASVRWSDPSPPQVDHVGVWTVRLQPGREARWRASVGREPQPYLETTRPLRSDEWRALRAHGEQ